MRMEMIIKVVIVILTVTLIVIELKSRA